MPGKSYKIFRIFQNFTSQSTKCYKMQSILKLAIVLCAIALAIAYPRGAIKAVDDNDAEPATRLERHSGGGGGHHHDVVDFGAHTGHKGSFGWYADFPVHAHH